MKKLNHANIVKLKEVIRENSELHFVFEFLDCNLYEVMKEQSAPMPESRVRNVVYQLMQGLACEYSGIGRSVELNRNRSAGRQVIDSGRS